MKTHRTTIIGLLRPLSVTTCVTLALIVAGASAKAQTLTNGLFVYPATPGLASSDKFSVSVRSLSDTTHTYQPVFTFQTKVPYATSNGADLKKYYGNLAGWSHSYANFVMNQPVRVQITKLAGAITVGGTKIYPANKVKDLDYFGGSLYFTMDAAANVSVDINRDMETVLEDGVLPPPATRTNWSAGSAPDPIHTISIHGNPPLDVPTTDFHTVTPLSARQMYDNFNSSGKKTLFFAPGVHRLGENFKVQANKEYYIPGNALVYGTFNNTNEADVPNVRIFGHGTISGGLNAKSDGHEFDHWEIDPTNGLIVPQDDPRYSSFQNESYKKRPIDLAYCPNGRIEGITITDPANNSINMHNTAQGDINTSRVSWVKIFAWRLNSDGGGCNGNSSINDCFYRTQDDGFYPQGKVLKDCVMWTDSNGANLRLTYLPNLPSGQTFRIENIDVIFRRNLWWSGSACIDLPSGENGNRGSGVTFSNINITDPKPTRAPIRIHQNAGVFSGTRFENITIEKLPRFSDGSIVKNELATQAGGSISNLTFHNLKIEGLYVTGGNWLDFFSKSGTNIQNPTFTSSSVQQNISNGTYKMKSASNVYVAAPATGSLLTSQATENGNSTKWIFTHLGNNEYSISSVGRPGFVMEIPYGDTGAWQKLALTPSGVNPDSNWKIWIAIKQGSSYMFVPKHDPLNAIDAYDSMPSIVHLYGKDPNNSNQLFTLIP